MPSDVAPNRVPDELRGAWRRTWICHADGSFDDTSTVVWIQLESAMADLRVGADRASLAERGALSACSVDELRWLAVGESSTGRTECTPIVIGPGGVRSATAEWFEGQGDVAFQPVTAYPEAGELEWDDSGSIMVERAPSGAYVEEWHRVPNSDGPLTHEARGQRTQIFQAGATAILVRDRLEAITRRERLDVIVDEAGDDRAALEAIVDCEFSLATVHDGIATITASTLPWRVGDRFDAAR